MVKINYCIKQLIIILIVSCFNMQMLYSQSQHSFLWNIGNYSLDFSGTEVQKSMLKNDILYNGKKGSFWYVDNSGELKIVYSQFTHKLYCKTSKGYDVVTNSQGIIKNSVFFIPNPCDENYVYCFTDNRYFTIDIQKNEVVSDIIEMQGVAYNHLAVHDLDFNNIWLIYYGQETMYYYLLSSSSLKYIKRVKLDYSQYNTMPKSQFFSINLSKDCKLYSAINTEMESSEVYFGFFDRTNADFNRLAKYKFSNYFKCVGSIISPDNTKIFYITQTDKSIDILQVKIIDNIPDFRNYQVLNRIDNNGGIFKIPDLFYGHDGNIYVAYYMDKVGMIEFDDDGNAHYEDNILPSLPHFYPRTLNFVSTWFSDDYHQAVCTPKISAENSCFGSKTDFSVINFSGAKTFLWNFGDGETSTEISPSHLYKKSGSYKVKLLIDGKDEYETDVEIYPQPKSPKVIETQ